MEGTPNQDRERVFRAKNGSAEAFGELVETYHERVWRISLRIVRDPDLASEITQEAFTRALKALPRFDFRASFYTWLVSIARNAAFDLWRSRKKRGPEPSVEDVAEPEAPEADRDPAAPLMRRELRERIQTALGRLNERDRTLIVLREYEDMQYEEIAQVMGLPVGTVESGLHRARKKLRDLLGGTLP